MSVRTLINQAKARLGEAAALIDQAAAELNKDRTTAGMLAIIVGHTRKSQGAYSETLGASEYEWNTELGRLMLQRAADVGLGAMLVFRDGRGVRGAYSDAKEAGADAIIELHFNSFGDPQANGTETLWATPESKAFARLIQGAIVEAMQLGDRGIKRASEGGRGHGNLIQAGDIPAIIVEPFFGSNTLDSQRAKVRQDRLARGLVDAADNWINNG